MGEHRKSYRFRDADIARLDWLSHRWGPIKPLSETDVIREALRRCMEAEAEKVSPRKRGPNKPPT